MTFIRGFVVNARSEIKKSTLKTHLKTHFLSDENREEKLKIQLDKICINLIHSQKNFMNFLVNKISRK